MKTYLKILPGMYELLKHIPSCHRYVDKKNSEIVDGVGVCMYELYMACRKTSNGLEVWNILKKMCELGYITNIDDYVHGCRFCAELVADVCAKRNTNADIPVLVPARQGFWGSYEQVVFLHMLARYIGFEYNPLLLAIVAPSVEVYPENVMDTCELLTWAVWECCRWCKCIGVHSVFAEEARALAEQEDDIMAFCSRA